MKKMLFACIALICIASCSGNTTTETTAPAVLEQFSKVSNIQALSVDTAMFYYSPEYVLQGIPEPITVDNIVSQSQEMKAQFRDDMSQRKPFDIFTVIGEKDTVYLRFCRGYDEYGSETQVLKPIELTNLFVPADRFESVLAELSK